MQQNGITTFIDSRQDYELAPVGIASFQEQAEKLADMGRHGDTYIVHAAEGETVLPMEVLDANPQLKQMLFTQMRDMGIEPERYIVGNQLNSINPATGQPEFFLKKIFKGLKNVGKALKKNAATLLPLALGYFVPGMGKIAAGGLGAGIGTLIQGDEENALRNALLGAGAGATLSGLRRAATPGGTFMGGVTGDLFQGLEGTRDFFSNPYETTKDFFGMGGQGAEAGSGAAEASLNPFSVGEGGQSFPGDLTAHEVNTALDIANSPSLADRKYSYIPFTEGYSLSGPTTDQILGSQEYANLTTGANPLSPDKALEILQKEHGPSFLQKYAVPAAGITGLAALGGFFDTPEEEEEEPVLTGQDLIDADPDKYFIDVARLPFEDQSRVGTDYPLAGIPSLQDLTPYPMPVFRANQGGPAFPRRIGNIGPGLGSGRRDDVPAMLTDGEFVMTRRAVKNAGNGSLNQGMKNMYSLMRNLETRRA